MMEGLDYGVGLIMACPPHAHSSNGGEKAHTRKLLSVVAQNVSTGQAVGRWSFQDSLPPPGGTGSSSSSSTYTEGRRPVELDAVPPCQSSPPAGALGHPGQWPSSPAHHDNTIVPVSINSGELAHFSQMTEHNAHQGGFMNQFPPPNCLQIPDQGSQGLPPSPPWRESFYPLDDPVSYPVDQPGTFSSYLVSGHYYDSSDALVNPNCDTKGPQPPFHPVQSGYPFHTSTSPPLYSPDFIHSHYPQANQEYYPPPLGQTYHLYTDTNGTNMVSSKHLLDQGGYYFVQRPEQDLSFLADSSDDVSSDETSPDPYSPLCQPVCEPEPEWDFIPSPPQGPLLPDSYSSDSSARSQEFDHAKKGKRKAFEPDRREQTERTRKRGACLRCQKQKIRCEEDENDPDGDCVTCAKVRRESKKVIHKFPCVRNKLCEAVLYRTGGLGLTKRWTEPVLKTLRDVGDWDGNEIRTIYWTVGSCEKPVEIQVRKFKPRPGDVLIRNWMDGQIRKRKELAPYALADVNKTAQSYMEHINETTSMCISKFLQDPKVDSLVKETYQMAWSHYESLPPQDGTGDNPEKVLLAGVWKLWTAITYMLGSAWIVGEDTLGMKPETDDPSYPLFGKVSAPRMIVAQFDAINSCKILGQIKRTVLKQLENLISRRGDYKPWYTLYLAVFVLLHTISLTSADRHRHAQANQVKTFYSIPFFVEELQRTANIILLHWHYYRGPIDLNSLSENWPTNKKSNPLTHFTPEQALFVLKSWHLMENKGLDIQVMQTAKLYHHDLYFVSQMYELGWVPKDTWRAS